MIVAAATFSTACPATPPAVIESSMKRLIIGIIIGAALVARVPQALAGNPGIVGDVLSQAKSAAVGLVNQTVNAIPH